MRCSACGRALSGFPGATVTCACGVRTTLAIDRPSTVPASTPYRAASARAAEPLEIACPYCGNTCQATVRVCPHCDVRLENVRCNRCYSLQAPGSFSCGRCGVALDLEPLLDATDAPCPRCTTPLEASAGAATGAPDVRLHECPRCGGIFVPREVLAEILSRAEHAGPFPEVSRAPLVPLDAVRYVPCPLCHLTMNRVNFGKVSGVIVDVCKKHGTWFDGGELTRVVAFAANGGLMKSRAREKADREREDRERLEAHRALVVLQTRAHAEERLREWQTFLDALFFW